MSMQPQPWPRPADEVAQAVRSMFAGRRAPLPVVVRDELDELFADAEFAEAFAVRGKPGWSPGRLAMITVLQAVGNLTDVQAAEAVQLRLDWKYCLGLSLADRGLDDSVLSAFRAPVDSWRMPASKTKRAALCVDYARDGVALLAAVWDSSSPKLLRQLPAVWVLQRVLIQNVVLTVDRQGREVIRLREADTDGLPPGRCRITSPYDTDARWGGKQDLTWNGYKLHVSESCDAQAPAGPVDRANYVPDAPPNLITNTATTDASVPDVAMTESVHIDLDRRGLLPGEHYVDSGYPSADLLVSSLTTFGVRLVTPMLADTSPQARAGAGFDRTGFTVDWDDQRVTCPNGKTNASWTPATQRGTQVIVVKFPGEVCAACPVKAQCTTATRGGRQLTLRPQPVQQALDQARAEQSTTGWQAKYARRAGVEATIAQAVKVTNVRRARYRGLAKTRLQHNIMAAALNLIRLDAWWNGEFLDPRRTTHLSRLELALAA